MESMTSSASDSWNSIVDQLDDPTDQTRTAIVDAFKTHALPLYAYERQWSTSQSDAAALLDSFLDCVLEDASFLPRLETERSALRTFALYALKTYRSDRIEESSGKAPTSEFFQKRVSDLEEGRSKLDLDQLTPDTVFDLCWATIVTELAWQEFNSNSPEGRHARSPEALEFFSSDDDLNDERTPEIDAVISEWSEHFGNMIAPTLRQTDHHSIRSEIATYLNAFRSVNADSEKSRQPDCGRLVALAMTGISDSSSEEEIDILWQPPELEEIAAMFPELEILKLIGRGGMSGIYEARQKELDRRVALKLSKPVPSDNPLLAERFEREAKAIATLSHPNIVTVFDYGFRSDHSFLLLELVTGGDVEGLSKQKDVSLTLIAKIICQVCDALQYAHDQGIIHRDIKPGNILLDQAKDARLADFGLAKITDSDSEILALTAEGKMVGTPKYLAPEQVENASEVDHRADIFSVGVVFYKLLTGELPIGRFEPPSELRSVDSRIDTIIFKALERDPEKRYQKISQMGAEVMDVLSIETNSCDPDRNEL